MNNNLSSEKETYSLVVLGMIALLALELKLAIIL